MARLEQLLAEREKGLQASTLQVGRLEKLVTLLESRRGELEEVVDSSQTRFTTLQREVAEVTRKLEQTEIRNHELESELKDLRTRADRSHNLVERLRVRERELEELRNQLLAAMVARDESGREAQLMRARARLAEEQVKSLQKQLER